MALLKRYPYFDAMVSIKEVVALKYPTVSEKWARDRLNKGMSVQSVLDAHVLTPSQSASRGAKTSKWGKASYQNSAHTREKHEASKKVCEACRRHTYCVVNRFHKSCINPRGKKK